MNRDVTGTLRRSVVSAQSTLLRLGGNIRARAQVTADTPRLVPSPRVLAADRRPQRRALSIVGEVGAFTDQGGVGDLLTAACLVIDRGVDLRLILVGEDPIPASIRALVADLELEDQVVLRVRTPANDLQRQYVRAAIAVFPRQPPLTPGLEMPSRLLTAMGMGKAVLVSNVGAFKEIVADGVSGLVFEKGDIDSLADALARLTTDQALRERIGTNARRWAEIERSFGLVAGHRAPLPALERAPDIPPERWRRLHDHHNRKRMRAILSFPWIGRVLEIGSGRGQVACHIARVHQPKMLVGIEPLPHYHVQSRQLASLNDIDDLHFVRGIGQHLPFPDGAFDRILISEVLEHIHRPLAVMRELARVLAPRGAALLTVPTHRVMPPGRVQGHVQDYTIAEFMRLIADAGLRVIEHSTVAVYEYYWVQRADNQPANRR